MEGLSTVASGVGKLLYPDAITRACTRLDFARVCIMLDITSKLPNHIIIMTPDERGGETPCKVDVEDEWVPPKCTGCMSLGHSIKDCPLTKPAKQTKPSVSVYVPKVAGPRIPRREENFTNTLRVPQPETPRNSSRLQVEESESLPLDTHASPTRCGDKRREDKGKSLVIFNTFDTLQMLEDVDETTGGPNPSSPKQVDVTIIYGATKVADRRELWDSLTSLARQCVDTPWLVGGDFNVIRDLSEVCGASGDIRLAMEEFNNCIQNAGLLPLPMQGE
ncbi:UNVERIFIED_CONTAM: hypothetical protein Sindi_2017300 [Sesamum indicum]